MPGVAAGRQLSLSQAEVPDIDAAAVISVQYALHNGATLVASFRLAGSHGQRISQCGVELGAACAVGAK